MATYMDPKKYENMIRSLGYFASKTDLTIEKLRAIYARCKQVLGENDLVATKMDPYIKEIAAHYEEASKEARRIAALMQQDLDHHYKKIEQELNKQDSE